MVNGYPKKGLIWHFQGSGKSLLMVFASQKLRMHRKPGNPTVMIVVDRIDLDNLVMDAKVIERIVTDIDKFVRLVRLPGLQNTKAGEREIQKALRKVVYVRYKIKDQDLFDKALGYIRQYY
jgi:hypothetical protein